MDLANELGEVAGVAAVCAAALVLWLCAAGLMLRKALGAMAELREAVERLPTRRRAGPVRLVARTSVAPRPPAPPPSLPAVADEEPPTSLYVMPRSAPGGVEPIAEDITRRIELDFSAWDETCEG